VKLEGKRVFITGIGGFIGPYLAASLLDRKVVTYGLVRRKAEGLKPKSLGDRRREIEFVEGDLSDISSLEFALNKSKPDVIFHLAAQSSVAKSFTHPLDTLNTNVIGTANLLEAIRSEGMDPLVVFAGSSEEYGLVITSRKQYNGVKEKFSTLFPEPETIPEVPVTEKNPLRPMSPYAVSKVQGEFLMRNYYHCYGIRTVVSRGFNHEGARRPLAFVTSAITSQVMRLKFGETDRIVIGNPCSFRDWSHVIDIVKGYCLLAEEGKPGEVYNQGSMRTNSVLSYLLLSLEQADWKVEKVEAMNSNKVVEAPTEKDYSPIFGVRFEKTKLDRLMLEGEIEFSMEDRGIWVHTDKAKIPVDFDPHRFRPIDVPILLSDTRKIQNLGFKIETRIEDIIRDQLCYFTLSDNRGNFIDVL
jgi:GDPmannose 4,6-dehydratase